MIIKTFFLLLYSLIPGTDFKIYLIFSTEYYYKFKEQDRITKLQKQRRPSKMLNWSLSFKK